MIKWLKNKICRTSPVSWKELAQEYKEIIKLTNGNVNSLKLKKWSDGVKKRDGKCMRCGNTEKLSSHHIYEKNLHKTLTYEIDNGITLCDGCHQGYHKKYDSMGSSKPSSLNEWINSYKG
jgi:hypothetical protein